MKKSKEKIKKPQAVVKEMVPDMPLSSLEHAPWNPRTEADLAEDSPEMQKLVASVKARGVIQPIAVWQVDGENGKRLVIAGNRRFAAAKYAGLATVPAVVFTGIAESEAREITRIENEVRLGISPLKDAELIDSMMGKYGYTPAEVAAHFGVSEATIRRRCKLINLVPGLRSIAERGGITADALERMALYPEAVQQSCVDSVARIMKRGGEERRWDVFKCDFECESALLDNAMFDTSDCAACPARTGAQADLWGDVEAGSLGRCLRKDCFERHTYEAELDRAYKIAVAGNPALKKASMVDGDSAGVTSWQAKNAVRENIFSEKSGGNCNVAWWWRPSLYAGNDVMVLWGPSPERYAEIMNERAAAQKQAEEKRQEEDKECNRLARELGEAFEKFQDALESSPLLDGRETEANQIIAEAVFGNAKAKAMYAADMIRRGIAAALWDDDMKEVYDFVRSYPGIVEAGGVTDEMIDAISKALKAKAEYEKRSGKRESK